MTARCGNCDFENPADARFCGNCGAGLTTTCGACGHANPVAFNFCTSCGTPLKADPQPLSVPAPEPATTSPGASWPMVEDVGPERRHLTVLFCDLVGSTELAQSLDPEDLRAVMGAYERACSDIVEGLGGYVAQFYGDGVLAYFGYPVAHEDAAERAVRAGLKMVEAVNDVPSPTKLQVRIGIHSGMVVVGMEKSGVPGKSNSAVGETPNIAARLQALAEPGTVMVSAATADLVEHAFRCEDKGLHPLRGIAEPVRVHAVLGVADVGRDIGHPDAGFVGRERELDSIMERWRTARDGAGQAVLMSGEAGIGKSRLVQELRDRLRDEPVLLMRHHCSPFHTTTPLYPIARAIEVALDISPGDNSQQRLEKVRDMCLRRGLDPEHALPLFADLLSIPPCETCPAPSLDPEAMKSGIMELLLALLANVSVEKPVLFVVANAQWADPTTLDFLGMAIDQIATLPVLLVITHRPEFQVPWPARAHVLPLTLTRMSVEESRVMANSVAGEGTLPTEVLDTIVERADGVPMFVTELTETMLASDYLAPTAEGWTLTGPLPPRAVPASLHDSLMARLDRLGPYKEVAQIGAMLGRGFRYGVLAAVSPLDDTKLRQALDELVRQEMLLQRGLPPNASYFFRQALVQEVAYETLLRSHRQEMHRRIGEVLESEFADIVDSEPEEIARHFAAAGMGERALRHRLAAARRSMRSSAMVEAVVQLDEAVALLAQIDDGTEKQRMEMEAQAMRGLTLAATQGYSAPVVREAYERALDLSQELADDGMHMRALLGLYGHSMATGEPALAHFVGNRLLALAEERKDDDDLQLANYLITGGNLSDRGKLAQAAGFYERAIAKLDVASPDQALWLRAQDPGVVASSMLARNRYILGQADSARRALAAAQERATAVNHAFSDGFARSVAASVLSSMRDWEAAEQASAAALELSEKHGFPSWQAQSGIFYGLASIKLGHTSEGIARLERALAVGEKIWNAGPSLFYRIALGEAALELGRVDEAISTVEEGLAEIGSRGGGAHEAELHRLLGSALRKKGDAAAATKAFERAVAIASGQGALSWELRATIELAEMRREAGDIDGAQERLAPVYDRLTEGRDTADAQRAAEILEAIPAA